MSMFKIGSKVKIIKPCSCQFWAHSDSLCQDLLNTIGVITQIQSSGLLTVKTDAIYCSFKKENLELVETFKEIKVCGLVKFLESIEKKSIS